MDLPAMSISNSVKLGLCAAALAMGAPAAAQVIEDEPDAMDVARTPLSDFNIDSDDIPEPLLAAARDPYASAGLETCNDIVAEIAEIDRVLGADFDIADEKERKMLSEGRIAQTIVRMFIPFGSIVREVSGANKKRREYNFALTAAFSRRAFLKGLGQGRGCEYPARPREERGTLTSGDQE